jgi:hypothetical protein
LWNDGSTRWYVASAPSRSVDATWQTSPRHASTIDTDEALGQHRADALARVAPSGSASSSASTNVIDRWISSHRT